MIELVNRIAEVVRHDGGQTLMVGGSVRDTIIHPDNQPKDYDIMVRGITLERLQSILPGRVELVGQSFGVLKVTADGITVDVALPRTEKSMGIGHRDFNVVPDPHLPIDKDLERRDFTMNAIAVDLLTKEVYDPFGGVTDIDNKSIKCVGNPLQRFGEDPLRMLRAARFASKLGFRVEPTTCAAMLHSSSSIMSVAAERVQAELDGILMGQSVVEGLRVMIHTHLMDHLIPEWMESYAFVQHNPHHDKTVHEHVLYALWHAAERGASLRARWAIFLHDIAKPRTFTRDDNQDGHFYKHEEVGAQMAVAIMSRLRCPDALIAQVAKIVDEHLNPPRNASDKVLRRYAARMADLTDDALMCREADLAAHAPPWNTIAKMTIDDYRARIATIPEISGFSAARLAVRGDEIVREFQVNGAKIGRLKEAAAQLVIDGDLKNDHDEVLGWLRQHAQEILTKGVNG